MNKFEELLLVDPKTLDSVSTYNIYEHTPYPSLNYVEKKTGVNLIKLTKSDEEAQATLVMITDLFRDMLYSIVLGNTKQKLEFLIAKHEDYRKAFIDGVCSLVLYARIKGIDIFLQQGGITIKELPISVQSKLSILLYKDYNFYLTQDQIRSDY